VKAQSFCEPPVFVDNENRLTHWTAVVGSHRQLGLNNICYILMEPEDTTNLVSCQSVTQKYSTIFTYGNYSR
jgi:hypothetical protein